MIATASVTHIGIEAINRITDLLWSNSIYLRHGSTNMVAKLIKRMYTERDVFGGCKNFPMLSEFLDGLEKLRFGPYSRSSLYQESSVRAVENLLNQMPDTFNCVRGHSIHQILNNNIILRVRGMSDQHYKIVVEDLLRCILRNRSSYPVEGIKNLIIVDEAHILLSGSSSIQEKGEDFMLRFARLCRSSGCDLLLSDQTPSLIQSAAMANMSTRITMQLVNGPCVRRMAESMSLSQEQAEALPRLKPRQAVMHFTGYPDSAFLIQIPELDYKDKISDEEINEIMAPVLARLEWTPCPPEDVDQKQNEATNSYRRAASSFRSVPEALGLSNNDTRGNGPASLNSIMIKEETDYLVAIAKSPFISVTQLDRSCNMSLYKGHQLRDRLAARGYVQDHRIKTGKRGNPLMVLEITEAGWQYLESIKAGVERYKGVGGFIHCYWQSKIKEWYERKYKACKATIEDKSSGKAVDVGVHFRDKKTAVEIMIKGERKEIKNIKEGLEHYDLVMCCAEDWESLNSLRERVEKEVEEDKRDKVWFKVLKDFLVSDDGASPSLRSGSAD
jgi:hypothetical protein